MAFVIIDLEFNNLSGIHKFYPDIYKMRENLKTLDLINEIIEIGVIKVDKYMKPMKKMKVYIKPSVIPVLNPNILNITGISEEDLIDGVSFETGMNALAEMVDEGDIICSWAKDDIVEIIRNSNYHNYKNLSWIKDYVDLQEYTTKILGFKKNLSLNNALKQLKIKYDEKNLHDALNDAIYEFAVFKALYNRKAVEKYIIKDIFEMPAVEHRNIDKKEIDYSKVKQICPRCGEKILLKYEFKMIGWRFVSIGACSRCRKYILNELIIKKTLKGAVIYKEASNFIDQIEFDRYDKRFRDK